MLKFSKRFYTIQHGKNIKISDVVNAAYNHSTPISISSSSLSAITSNRQHLLDMVGKQNIYAVSTKVGDKCDHLIDCPISHRLFQNHLITGHQSGVGSYFSPSETRAILFVRLITLSKGFSGISTGLIDQLLNLLNHNILPMIPERGSVGASGDLVPNSYIGGAIKGCKDTKVRSYNGDDIMSAYDALLNNNIEPYQLQVKEGISIINGLNVSSAMLSLLMPEINNLIKLSTVLTGCTSNIMQGNPYHFDSRIAELKPFEGVKEYCSMVRSFQCEDHMNSNDNSHAFDTGVLQQRYSIRCAPHIGGLGIDLLGYFSNLLEIELNSVNDNPIIYDSNLVLHSGNFYGGYLCFMSDSFKNIVTNITDMLDRQIMLLLDSKFSHLDDDLIDHDHKHLVGFKSFNLCSSALAAESNHLSQTMSIFSRSTEGHNQDKVSMCTISILQLKKIINLCQEINSLYFILIAQAVDLREKSNHNVVSMNKKCLLIRDYIRQQLGIPFIDEKQINLHDDIQRMLKSIKHDGGFMDFINKDVVHEFADRETKIY